MQAPAQPLRYSNVVRGPDLWMYVSTALEFIFLKRTDLIDLEIDGQCFRRLDPIYFAWLEHVLSSAQSARQLGSSDLLLQRALLEPIRVFAKARFAPNAVEEAQKRLKNAGAYRPPSAQTQACDTIGHLTDKPAVKPGAHHTNFHRTPPENIAKDLEVILVVAAPKGFDREDLFGSGSELAFPLGNDWGLACFLDGGMQIAHIEPGAIVLTGPPPHRSSLVWRPRQQRASDLMSYSAP